MGDCNWALRKIAQVFFFGRSVSVVVCSVWSVSFPARTARAGDGGVVLSQRRKGSSSFFPTPRVEAGGRMRAARLGKLGIESNPATGRSAPVSACCETFCVNGLEQLHQLQADDGRQSRNRSSIINPIGFL